VFADAPPFVFRSPPTASAPKFCTSPDDCMASQPALMEQWLSFYAMLNSTQASGLGVSDAVSDAEDKILGALGARTHTHALCHSPHITMVRATAPTLQCACLMFAACWLHHACPCCARRTLHVACLLHLVRCMLHASTSHVACCPLHTHARKRAHTHTHRGTVGGAHGIDPCWLVALWRRGGAACAARAAVR
jgi:hypothetical protein